jgi:hypothetical protein
MRYSPRSSLLCATQVLFQGVLYAIFSTVALMGDQDVNHAFNQVTVALDEKVSRFITEQTRSPLPLSSAYVGDLVASSESYFLDLVHDKMRSLVGDCRAPGLCFAESAINLSKDIRGTLVEALGWLFDVPLKSVHPKYLTFAKLVYYFFTAIGAVPFAGLRVSVRILMVMGDYAMRAANVLTAGTVGTAGSGVNSNFCGVGDYIPGFAWFGERLSELSIMCIGSARFTDTNINVLDLFALLTAATLAIEQLQSMQSSVGCHVHIYCDNVSAISKCRTHRSNHPVYTYLLHLLSLLQLRNRCTIGTSFLKGKENVVADAASRTFLVPRATVIYNRHLAQLPYHRLSGDSI